MINKNIRNRLHIDTIGFNSPSFDNSIIGFTLDGRTIYVLGKMATELAQDDGCSYEDALEYIEYNTIRSIPYISGKAPVVLEDSYMHLYQNE